jgi:dephospho-CoA kinase
MKIGIIGPICAGKSTLANYIINYYKNNFNIILEKESFASKIYELAYDIFNMKNKDRKLLQSIGTKMREINQNCWVNYTIKKCNKNDYSIIDDGRYLNEIDAMKENKFILIRINIDEQLQIERIKSTYKDTWESHINNMKHLSELDIYKYPDDYFDLIINAKNDKDFAFLNNILNKWYNIYLTNELL